MEFENIASNAASEWNALTNSNKPVVYVGTSTCGCSSEVAGLFKQISEEIQGKGLDAVVIETGSFGLVGFEPMVIIAKPGKTKVCYGNVTAERASKIVENYLVKDDPMADLALCTIGEDKIKGIKDFSELPFFKGQARTSLRNCGLISPDNINHYIANGGYSGLAMALKTEPGDAAKEAEKAGLRGRGGAGFPSAEKWAECFKQESRQKYFICNAAEGDPGVYIAKVLFESDPHSVLEGMLIGAYASGASHGFIYINHQYPMAIARIENALKQMKEKGLLGGNILGSNFNFHIEVREGSGAFVAGEESALLNSLEGKRAMPSIRPPYPAQSGLYGKPTVINNVETLANVTSIFQKGADSYAAVGTEKSKGTKIFVLGGSVTNQGLVEVPMGMTVRQIVEDMGGGVAGGKGLKAVQVGGPTGGWLSGADLDMPLDYEHLKESGHIMGSGSIFVADETSCAVDLAKNALLWIENESCGKCVFGREGTLQLALMLTDITEGMGKKEDIEVLEEFGEGMKEGAFCNFGKTAANPVLTTIKYFRDEYTEHIINHNCPAKVCKIA
jgi:NADH-quinone oxidoreductase subunit F